jgi:hypothetical protein
MLALDQLAARSVWVARAQIIACAAAILLALPSLTAPLLQDDVVHRVMLLDNTPDVHWGPLELYDFIGAPTRPAALLRDHGFLPWFAGDQLQLRFFRPISSALLAADVYFFGDRVWAARVHSLLWFFGVLALCAVLQRRFLSAPSAALGTLIYAVSVGHALPVSWIAARHALVSSTFALVSFWFHVRARDDGWRVGRWLSPVGFLIALLAGEMALGALALIVAWELFGRSDTMAVRFRALFPCLVIALLYLAGYVAMGYGVRGSGGYVSMGDGISGALVIARHFLILIAELVAATPSDAFGTGAASIQVAGAVWGVFVTAVAAAVFWFTRSNLDARDASAMSWLPAAAAAAALPGALALIGGRVLTLALVPASGAVAVLLISGMAALRQGLRGRATRIFVKVAIVCLAIDHLVVAPVLRVIISSTLTRFATRQQEIAAATPPCEGVMVLVAAADPIITTYVPATLALRHRRPERLRVLSMAPAAHRIENVTDTGFDLVTVGERATSTLWEQLYGGGPMRSGTRVRLTSFEATVLEDHDGVPSRVRFDFGEKLASPHLCLVAWRDGAIEALEKPQPGMVIDVPYHPGPMGW